MATPKLTKAQAKALLELYQGVKKAKNLNKLTDEISKTIKANNKGKSKAKPKPKKAKSKPKAKAKAKATKCEEMVKDPSTGKKRRCKYMAQKGEDYCKRHLWEYVTDSEASSEYDSESESESESESSDSDSE
jgi:ElaB/YqjD/DUF883 family membrane-anchored ribosome-binding protein